MCNRLLRRDLSRKCTVSREGDGRGIRNVSNGRHRELLEKTQCATRFKYRLFPDEAKERNLRYTKKWLDCIFKKCTTWSSTA